MSLQTRVIILCIIALSLTSCVGARPRVSFDSGRVPVSMSGVVLGHDGQPLGPKDQLPVGRFAARKKAYAMVYSYLPLNSMDFSEDLNHQVEAVQGEAVVNLEISIMRSSCLTWHLVQVTQILPIFLGCVDVSLNGDVIRARPEGKTQKSSP